jgi:hypothetical protein
LWSDLVHPEAGKVQACQHRRASSAKRVWVRCTLTALLRAGWSEHAHAGNTHMLTGERQKTNTEGGEQVVLSSVKEHHFLDGDAGTATTF